MLITKLPLIVSLVTLLVGSLGTTELVSHRQRPALLHPVRDMSQFVQLQRAVPRTNWESSFFMALELHDRWPSQVKKEVLGPPRSGWDSLWKQLSGAGVLVLPDGDRTKCRSLALDGGGFVIETMVKREYRTYRYSNPQFAGCDEAKRVLEIERIIGDEFSVGVSKN